MDPQDLYGLPLEQFTDRRNQLARALRRDGRRDEAAAVAKLRKPSVAAWAVNQLVRTQRHELGELVGAGDALQRAQADLLSKRGDATALRRAVDRERAAASRLAERARGLLNADGHELTPARLEQVTETLHAAALDEDARASVRSGCLERELRHVGLGELGVPAPMPSARASRRRPAQEDRSAELTRQAAQEARRRLDRAMQELERATRRRERAGEELRAAEDALGAARKHAAEAEREHKRATRRLERA